MTRRKPYTWEQNLRLLAEAGTPKQLKTGYVEFELVKRKDLAAQLGISPRTLRRWLNEGTTPSPDNQQRIQQAGKRRRRSLKRAGYPDLPIIPYAHRRQLKEWDFTGRKPKLTGKTYTSNWVNYHVAGWSVHEMLGFIETAYGFNNRIQFMFRINRGPEAGLGHQGATRIFDLDTYDIQDIAEIINEIIYRYSEDDEDELNEIMWIGLIDPKSIGQTYFP